MAAASSQLVGRRFQAALVSIVQFYGSVVALKAESMTTQSDGVANASKAHIEMVLGLGHALHAVPAGRCEVRVETEVRD
jgi:hypothetical protein